MLNVKSFGLATGVTWGLFMLALGLIGAAGVGIGVINALGTMYIGFNEGIVGAIIGFVYGFIDGLIFGLILSYLYNVFEGKMK